VGIVSPVGPDAESSWQALLAGRSGVAATAGIDVTDLPVRIAAQVPDLDVAAMLGVRQTRALDRFAQLAVIAAREAVISAGWS
jgi:3-oxoacyl-[acyl-carrier-protein] synthase II